jgi:hypothetical protein
MTIDRVVLAFAGFMVVASVALTYFVSPWWVLLTLFVGLNLFQSAFTGICPLATVLRICGVAPGAAFCAVGGKADCCNDGSNKKAL